MRHMPEYEFIRRVYAYDIILIQTCRCTHVVLLNHLSNVRNHPSVRLKHFFYYEVSKKANGGKAGIAIISGSSTM